MKDFHFDAISAFENYEIEKMRDGHVVVTTKVVDSSLNYYGNAHGGYLFTLVTNQWSCGDFTWLRWSDTSVFYQLSESWKSRGCSHYQRRMCPSRTHHLCRRC